jgi:hypothetical protein
MSQVMVSPEMVQPAGNSKTANFVKHLHVASQHCCLAQDAAQLPTCTL